MSDSSLNSVVSFKRQKFWHVQISVILDGELLSCDMKIPAENAAAAYHNCLHQAAEEIAACAEETAETAGMNQSQAFFTAKAKIHAGIVFKRVVLVTNPAMMCAGGSGMRIAARDDQGKQEQKAKIEVKES